MASTNYINECKNDAYKNRLGKIEIAEKKVTTGTSIKIEKGADSAIDLTLYGRSTQATRSGYNLVKNGNKFKGACGCATGITGSLTNEGYQQFDVETGNGNWTTNWFYSINQEIEENLSEGDTFTIMFTMRRTEGMSIPPKIYIKNGMGYYSMIGTLSTEFSVVYYTGTWKDTNGIAPHLGFAGLTGTFIIKNWMIKKGGLEEWEDYGVMPSPDFPSPIESVGRKNLFDYSKLNNDNTIQWTAYSDVGAVFRALPIYVGKNKKVYFSTNVPALKTENAFYAINNINETTTNQINIDNSRVVNSNNDGYVYLGVVTNRQYYEDVQNNVYWIMISTDNVEYLPYEHTEINATVTGKNLLENKTKNSGINRGITFTLNGDGSYTLNGTNDGTGNSTVFLSSSSNPTTLKAGTYYTIPTPNGVQITGAKIGGGYFQFASSSRSQFTLNEDIQAQIYIQVPNGITTTYNNIKVYPMISTTPITQTDYEEYKSNSLTIDLQGNELCSLPSGTKDEVNITNGKSSIVKRTKEFILDENKTIVLEKVLTNTTRFLIYNVTSSMNDYPSAISTHFKYLVDYNLDTEHFYITRNGAMYLFVNKSIASTVDELKTWLSKNNVKFLYELAEPETVNLGTVEMPHTYNGVSNITNSADTEMTVKAYEWTGEITNYDNLQSIQIDSGCYTDGNIIGSVYVECLNASFVAEATNLVDKIIRCQIGVKYADLSTEYICKGKYIVERPNNEITAQMSQITAYSDLYTNLEAIYICNLDYSAGNITLKDVYIDVCKQLGLTPLKTDFLNSTIPITDNPFKNNEKNRVVLQTISKIACSFVNVYEDNNQIDLCWLSENAEPDYTFEMSDYVSVEGGQVICGPINCLIIKNSQIDDENVTIKDDESIKTNGEHSITISDDYILHNAELRQQAITSIWNRVKGLKYVDCKLITYYGKPFLKLGNKIRVYTSDTDYFDTYVLKHKFEYDGAFASTIESPALTEQEIKTKQDISLGKALTNVQIDLDKQKERITSTVTTTNALQDSVSNLSETVQEQANQMQTLSTTLTQTNQSLQAEVNQINESLENGVSNLKNKLVTIDINGIAVSTNTSTIKAIMNNDRFAIKNGNTEAFYVGYDENLKKSVSRMNDLTITDYFTAGYHRQEKFEINGEQRTGWFYVGGE